MAAMQRDQFVTELQNRGWSGFAAADLQRYADWALQELHTLASFDPKLTSTPIAATTNEVTFAELDTGTGASVDDVRAVFITTDGLERKLQPLTEAKFFNQFYVETLKPAADRVSGIPTDYYVYKDTIWFSPFPSQAIDVEVHWMLQKLAFANGTDTTGLPERFDKILLELAEKVCHERAHEWEEMMLKEQEIDRKLRQELGQQGGRFREEFPRIAPYGSAAR